MFYIQQDEKIVLFDDDKQRLQNTIAFTIPQYQGLEIKEVQEGYVIYNLELMTVEEKEEKEAQKERERLDMLFLTGADVERAIYKVKGIDFDDILAMVKDNPAIDEKALKIEFKANNFFRGNPYISQVGLLLGFTSEQLDKFFETKDYHYLTTCKLTINVTPTEATITGNGSYPYGTLVDYKVELEGYKPYTGSIELLKDTELNIELEKIEEVVDENTTDTTTDIQDELDTTTSKSDETNTDILE